MERRRQTARLLPSQRRALHPPVRMASRRKSVSPSRSPPSSSVASPSRRPRRILRRRRRKELLLRLHRPKERRQHQRRQLLLRRPSQQRLQRKETRRPPQLKNQKLRKRWRPTVLQLLQKVERRNQLKLHPLRQKQQLAQKWQPPPSKPAERDARMKEKMKPVWRNARTCLKPGIFFLFLWWCSVYFSETIPSIMTAMSMAVMGRRCTGQCAASSLLIGALHLWCGWVWKYECGCECFFFCFLHETHDCVDTLLNLTYLILSIWCWAIGCSS